MKIYTKTGDKGKTSLYSGERVKKYSLRVDVYGTIDELNSFLGLAVAQGLPDDMHTEIKKIMNETFSLCSDLANSAIEEDKAFIQQTHINDLEANIDKYTEQVPELKDFILPTGTVGASTLHVSRSICRRAERLATRLAETENVSKFALIYLNRLSDFLFTAARYANHAEGREETKWKK